MTQYEFFVFPVFKICLKRLVYFLQLKYSLESELGSKHKIKNAITDILTNNPYIKPISERLIDLGVKDFRQYSIDEHNIIFYRINDDRKAGDTISCDGCTIKYSKVAH